MTITEERGRSGGERNTMTTRPLPAGNFPFSGPRIGISRPTVTKSLSSTADEALIKLYANQSRSLLGLASLLARGAARGPDPLITAVTDADEAFQKYAQNTGSGAGEFSTTGLLMVPDVIPGIAEEIVEDAFVALRAQWRRLRDPDRCATFLRRFIVQATRCLDGLAVAGGGGLPAPGDRTLAALGRLPVRQREALVLRYYADLQESQAAAAMGVTRSAFRWHVTRGMRTLRLLLDAHGVAKLSTS
jgi:hypothetical protein